MQYDVFFFLDSFFLSASCWSVRFRKKTGDRFPLECTFFRLSPLGLSIKIWVNLVVLLDNVQPYLQLLIFFTTMMIMMLFQDKTKCMGMRIIWKHYMVHCSPHYLPNCLFCLVCHSCWFFIPCMSYSQQGSHNTNLYGPQQHPMKISKEAHYIKNKKNRYFGKRYTIWIFPSSRHTNPSSVQTGDVNPTSILSGLSS